MLSKITAAVLFASALAAPTPLVKHNTLNDLSKVGALGEGVLDKCLVHMGWRSETEVLNMSEEDKRNTVVHELSLIPGLATIPLLQGKDNGQLSETCKEIAPVTISGLDDEYDGTYHIKEVSKKLFSTSRHSLIFGTTQTYEDGNKFEKEDGRCLVARMLKNWGGVANSGKNNWMSKWELLSTCESTEMYYAQAVRGVSPTEAEAGPDGSDDGSAAAARGANTRPCDSSLDWKVQCTGDCTSGQTTWGGSIDCTFD